MKKVLCFLSRNDFMALEEAEELLQQGDELFFLGCDSSVGICHENNTMEKGRCVFCKFNMKNKVKKLHKKYNGIKYYTVSDYVSEDIIKQSKSIKFTYNSVKELKGITFHNIEIGYGAFSNFVSYTRNIEPTFNNSFYEYIDKLLVAEVRLILVLERLLTDFKPDLIVFHNGRFVNLKPIYGIAINSKIDYVATETIRDYTGKAKKNNFYNDIPHSWKAVNLKMQKAWIDAGERRLETGESFFCNRRRAVFTGDKIYVKDQDPTLLPDNFNPNIRNIVIFNSSEDEYFSISKEYDESVLYPTQYDALYDLFERYKNEKNIHFYLRIHPNLKDVNFKSTILLNNLKYNNVTLIPPSSPVSSYKLMEIAETVIVFNSTMGLESAYWGKKVIALNHSFYEDLNVVYTPKTKEEFFNLLDDKYLMPIGNIKEKCAKGGCYCLGCHGESFKYAPDCIIPFKYNPRLKVHSYFTFLGSPHLNLFLEGLLCNFYHLFDKNNYDKLAEDTK